MKSQPFITVVLFLLSSLPLFGQEFYEVIDQQIEQSTTEAFAGQSTDSEFLRRIYLDLIGQIPTADEARKFLSNTAIDKRSLLIDQLLQDPRYTRRMTEFFNVMLMERRGEDPNWQLFLSSSFKNNVPWNQMVKQMVSPDTKEKNTRGAAYFLTKRLEKYGQNPTDFPGLARDIGRMFLGMDLACAQCHDHLFIDDYKQADFQGLFAFINNSFIRRDTDYPAIGMNPVKVKLEFNSVFAEGTFSTGPKLPGMDEIPVPEFVTGEEFSIPPNKDTKAPGIPKFNPLDYLARQLPTESNQSFNVNAVNRIWFLMMGRGIVQPLDLHHSDNPPSHPELLQLMGQQLSEHNYDIKWLIRQIALSKTYQRTGVVNPSVANAKHQQYRVYAEKPMSAEQLMWSMLTATGQLSHIPREPADSEPDTDQPLDDRIDQTLEGIRADFLAAYANPPREPETEFAPSVRGALFILNGPRVLSWLSPRPGNLAELLNQQADNYAETLYLSILSRKPTSEEAKQFNQYISSHSNQAKAIEQAIWALLASNEFSINH
ncbi:MAG: hypothetical protein CMJ76_16670 [Planctomycetaceae bacterium]|nr:hypothetical protein [Planctomycetaceae bacterium]